MENLSPWEANRWFELPKETHFDLIGATPIKVAVANPMRVGLLFGVPTGNTAGVNFSLNPAADAGHGFAVSATVGFLPLTHSEWGKLVTVDWYAIGGAAGQSCSVIELVLRDWPVHDPDDTADVRDMIGRLTEEIKLLSARMKAGDDAYALHASQGSGY